MEVGKNGDPSNQSPRQQDSWIQIASRKPSPKVVGSLFENWILMGAQIELMRWAM